MLIINLNIRGSGGGTKAKYLRQIIASEGAKFVCIQETKTTVISNARCFVLWGDSDVGWLHNEGENGGGSLLTMWKKVVFGYESHVMGKAFIAIFGQHLRFSLRCVIVNVYAACAFTDKERLWEELTNIIAVSQDPIWCFCGDFNAVRTRSERKGVSSRDNRSRETSGFNNFIETNLLLDLRLVVKKYTWFKANGSVKNRLDRVLVSKEWLHIWPMSKQYVQRREVSDHCSLVVKSMDKDWGPRPFKTIDAWHMERGFNGMVKEKCQSYVVQGNEITKLKDKLKMLKGDLKVWNRDVYGNLHTKKKDILQEIESLDCQDMYDFQLGSVRVEIVELMSRLREIDSKIDSLISQKARMNWLKYGDSCTKFYHSSIRWRRLRNELKGDEVGGQWCEEPCRVRIEAKKLFDNRFKATKDLGVRLDAIEFKMLT